jgi:hypothetical protein
VWATRNVISGNGNDGVLLGTGGSSNVVQGNILGANVNSTVALANQNGIEVASLYDTIGGTTSPSRNFISGNRGDGVVIDSGGGKLLLEANYIGLNTVGSALGNGGYGVRIAGSKVQAGVNLIAFNASGGVLVSSGSSNVLHNNVYANGPTQTGPGIVLDAGANNNVAAPSLTSATLVGSTLTVTGTFDAPMANVPYRLDFYANPSGDAEGKIYLGDLTMTPNSTGSQPFTFTVTTTVTGTDPLITATLTDNGDNTSAFSSGAITS